MSTTEDVKSHQPGMCWCGDEHKWHQLGMCWCGFEHAVPDVMLERARDLFLFNPKTTSKRWCTNCLRSFTNWRSEIMSAMNISAR